MKTCWFALILTGLLFLPGLSAAEDPLYCLLDPDVLEREICPVSFAGSRHKNNIAGSELSAEELDQITAGGLENIRINHDGSADFLGRIILWDEVIQQSHSQHIETMRSFGQNYSMSRLQVNGVFDAID